MACDWTTDATSPAELEHEAIDCEECTLALMWSTVHEERVHFQRVAEYLSAQLVAVRRWMAEHTHDSEEMTMRIAELSNAMLDAACEAEKRRRG
jgi:hypothetical protein